MENPVKKYELEQDGKKYTLSTQIFEDKLRFVCIEVNQLNPLVYTGEFSLKDIMQLNEIFASITTISQAEAIFDQILVNQKVSLETEGNFLNLKIILKKDEHSDISFTLKLNLFKQNVVTNEQMSSQQTNNIQINSQQQSLNPIISFSANSENMNYSNNPSTNNIQTGYEHISQVQQVSHIQPESTTIDNNIISNSNNLNASSSPYITTEQNIQIQNNGSIPSGNIMLNTMTNNPPVSSSYVDNHQVYQAPETQVQTTASNIGTHSYAYNASSNVTQEQYGNNIGQKADDIMLNTYNNQYNNEYTYENVQKHKTKRKRVDKLTLSLRAVPNDNPQNFNEIIRSSLNRDTAKIITTPIIEEQPVTLPSFAQPSYEHTIQTTEYTMQIDNLKSENNRLNDLINQLRSRIETLTQENQYLKLRNNELLKNMSNGSEKQEIIMLREENGRLRKEIETLQRKLYEFEEYKRVKEEEINYLKVQNEELSKNLKRIEEYGMQKDKEIEELKLYIEELIRTKKIDELQYQNILRQQQQNSSMNTEEKVLSIQDTRLEIVKGDIIQNTAELELLTRKISKNNRKIILNLLYKATIDSDKAEIFHQKCDPANSSLVLIKSGNGKRFGGYTSCNWKGNSIEKKDENAFVFSLDKMKIYENIPGEDAIGCYPKYGPIFLGCQIRIYDEFFTNGGTTFEKGLNYKTEEDFELSGGLKEYDVKEIEVYSVEVQ